ncbi:MAG: amidohydrolase family protein [Actinomycetia bacterium]|nr:amidohydrolase family protein [Actinomycetes bacterium]
MPTAPIDFALKGDIVYNISPTAVSCTEDGYLVCVAGRSAGVFSELPEAYRGIELRDFSGHLIIPGLIDLHTHAPQYSFRGLGMDLELLDWLNSYTFPEETRYASLEYAQQAYRAFVQALLASATTRAVIFATVHTPATLVLAEMLEKSGLITRVGKVNMDRNGPECLIEADATASLLATRQWLEQMDGWGFKNCLPILTPRFIPSCSNQLLAGLGKLQKEFGLPVQSHLSENLDEVKWVHQLRPEAANYADAYRQDGLLGGDDCPTIMAHCVYSDPQEIELLADQGVWVAHCPTSNSCLASGIAPVRRFMECGLMVGLGSDVAGGFSLSLARVAGEAVQVSKLRWRLVDGADKPLSALEAIYLATAGGGSFFGQVGSFDAGYELDAVVLAYAGVADAARPDLASRLERFIYLDNDYTVCEKYVAGHLAYRRSDRQH